MFGQQPQQQSGYPQQGYGYQPQQRQPAQLSSLGELLAGNGAKAYFGANSQPGDTVTGVIEKIETTQVNDFQTKQPAFWNDGRPKEQIHVIIQTQLRDPSVEEDDGRRSLWVKGWGIQLKAFREACMQAGVKIPKPGDTITETYIGLGERGNAPQPPKVFSFRIEPANGVNNLLNGGQPQQPVQQAPQQPVMQQPQKVTRSGSTSHSSLSRPRIRDIRQLRWTRGTLPRNSSRSNPFSRCSSASRSSRRLIR